MSALEDLALIQSDYRRARLAGLPIDTAVLFDALDRLDLSGQDGRALSKDKENLEAEIEELEGDKRSLEDEVADLESEADGLREEIRGLEAQRDELEDTDADDE